MRETLTRTRVEERAVGLALQKAGAEKVTIVQVELQSSVRTAVHERARPLARIAPEHQSSLAASTAGCSPKHQLELERAATVCTQLRE